MKRFPIAALVCFGALAARGDLVITETIETSGSSAPATIGIKGQRVRIDLGVSGNSLIVDLSSGTAVALSSAEKSFTKLDLASVRTQAQALGGHVEKPVASGKIEKVGDWNAEIYHAKSGGVAFDLWVAKDVPNLASIQEQLRKLSEAGVAPSDLALFELPGVVVKTEINGPKGKITSMVTGIEEAPLDESRFTVPADYRKAAGTGLPAPIP
ncbi:MAG TPA: DUF4412 domain-containing protein [Chthoniobacteraceae bacterium]|jgi:hypothetical protein